MRNEKFDVNIVAQSGGLASLSKFHYHKTFNDSCAFLKNVMPFELTGVAIQNMLHPSIHLCG